MRVANPHPMNTDWLFCRIYGAFIFLATLGVVLLGAFRYGSHLLAATAIYLLMYVVFFGIHTWSHRANRNFSRSSPYLLLLFVFYHCLVGAAAIVLPNHPLYLGLMLFMYFVSVMISIKYFGSTMIVKPIIETQ
jgi:heme A synthase